MYVGSLKWASHSGLWHWQTRESTVSQSGSCRGQTSTCPVFSVLIKNSILSGDLAGEQLKTQTFLLRFKPGGKNTNNCSAK